MPEQTTTPARHQKILDAASNHLDRGDVRAYWKTLEQISPAYAKIAGQVAGNEGPIGTGARERLQDAAEEARGKRFTETEMDKIETGIAQKDRDIRQINLDETGKANVSLRETAQYHAEEFGEQVTWNHSVRSERGVGDRDKPQARWFPEDYSAASRGTRAASVCSVPWFIAPESPDVAAASACSRPATRRSNSATRSSAASNRLDKAETARV